MLSTMINFTSLLLASLLVGAMFGVWLVFNPARLDATPYIILQQQGIRTLHPMMPRLGALTLLFTVAAAILSRDNRPRFALLIATVFAFVISGVITRFANMPINAIVIHWSSIAPPDQWTDLRDAWWRWHCLRLGSALTGLILLITAMLWAPQQ
jgi:Domain of unknown function (DUF1772)